MARQIFIQVLDADARGIIERLLGQSKEMDRKIRDVISAETKALVAGIRDIWPVETGFSRSQFRAIGSRSLTAAVINKAIYSGYVHKKGEEVPLVDSTLPILASQTRDRILARLGATVERQVEFALSGAASAFRTLRQVRAVQRVARVTESRGAAAGFGAALASAARSVLSSSALSTIFGVR